MRAHLQRTPTARAPIKLRFIVVALLLCGSGFAAEADLPPELLEAEAFIQGHVDTTSIPGLSAAMVKNGRVVWSKGFGLADLDGGVPMAPDTIFNVASLSKTVVNAAVLQLWEDGLIELDDDVNDYLPFPLENPAHPGVPISFRHLLTHYSGIRDGAILYETYACGDPQVSLADWIEGYFESDGAFHDPDDTFFNDAPGDRYRYSNLGTGLLAYLVERITGESFGDYTQARILDPLGMDDSSWFIGDIDPARQAVTYTAFVQEGSLEERLLADPDAEPSAGIFRALCPYSFYNYPDGLLRTNASGLAALLLMHMGDGSFGGERILERDTLDTIFADYGDRGLLGGDTIQGLTWHTELLGDGDFAWGHTGSDPGVTSNMFFRPEEDVGVIVLATRNSAPLEPVVERLFEVAIHVPEPTGGLLLGCSIGTLSWLRRVRGRRARSLAA